MPGGKCGATVGTDAHATLIVSSSGKHHGPHPVTMNTLAVSPTKCSPIGSRLSSGALTSLGQSNVTPSPPVIDVGSYTSIACAPTQVVPMTPPAVSPVSRVGISTPLADSEDWTTVKRVADLLAENSKLKDSILQLSERYKHVLDHLIESDTRSMQYTDQIEEFYERYRGADVLQFNNIGREAFTQHGMPIKKNTKHLKAQELIECLRKIDSTTSRATSKLLVAARGPQNNEPKSDQALESPTAPLSTTFSEIPLTGATSWPIKHHKRHNGIKKLLSS
ncbi:hypothetical protein J6590_072498 [Homalodisca vitripennis]|nr:hypothetical protein J6590_072498 [Homalodisca vitripennis]